MTAAATTIPATATIPHDHSSTSAPESQWHLTVRRFAKHRIAVWSLLVLSIFYILAALAEFFAPYPANWRDLSHAWCPPQTPRLTFSRGLHVRAMKRHIDQITYANTYVEDPADTVPLGFFVRGEKYRLWGLIAAQRHFFAVDAARYDRLAANGAPPPFFLLGADQYGRDIFSRIIHGARISLSIGLLSIAITFLLGVTIGGISGYVGGHADNVIQRLMEILSSVPSLPLWLGLAAAMPAEWSPLQVYFSITVVLSLLGWPGLARVVRGKILALREEDYAVAARLLGASHTRIIFRHLLPGFTSHIVITLTLSIPGMILGEVGLSFLGLGLRAPVVSWGVMLQDCMNLQNLINYPWVLTPVFFVIGTVLCFNFIGDGMRDAADPYSGR